MHTKRQKVSGWKGSGERGLNSALPTRVLFHYVQCPEDQAQNLRMSAVELEMNERFHHCAKFERRKMYRLKFELEINV